MKTRPLNKLIVVVMLLMFSVMGLVACSGDLLTDYKADAKAEIDAHVATKVEADYSEDNWATILGFVTTGKEAIDAAENKAGVDAAVSTAKTGIDNVPKGENMGSFYSLQDAYDAGMLTVEDLRSIAYYQNRGSDDESFVPKPKSPVTLSVETESAIKKSAVASYSSQKNDNGESMYPNVTTSDFTIIKYCGTYNGSIAIMLSELFDGYTPAVMARVVVAGVTFVYSSGNRIIIWKQA